MYLQSLRLRSYRNYQNETVDLSKGINVIIGENGEGKTNLLEAVYLLSTTRSHRNDNDRDLIMFDKEFASIDGVVNTTNSQMKLGVVLHKSGKTLLINGVPVKRNSEFIGKINAVLFSPSDMSLFSEAPRSRRRLIDIEIGKLSPTYMYSLNSYLKCLKERNAYLKENIDKLMLETYTEMLYEPQIKVIKARSSFVGLLNNFLTYYYCQLSGDNAKLKVVYSSMIKETEDEEVMLQQLKEGYDNILVRDIYLKSTNIGIHREDYIFYLDDKEVEKYCSQGQKRMVLLALKLSITQIIYQIRKEYPVLLLDDVLSELDSKRRSRLLNLIPAEVQTIITTTDIDKVDLLKMRDVKLLNIKKGMIVNGK